MQRLCQESWGKGHEWSPLGLPCSGVEARLSARLPCERSWNTRATLSGPGLQRAPHREHRVPPPGAVAMLPPLPVCYLVDSLCLRYLRGCCHLRCLLAARVGGVGGVGGRDAPPPCHFLLWETRRPQRGPSVLPDVPDGRPLRRTLLAPGP